MRIRQYDFLKDTLFSVMLVLIRCYEMPLLNWMDICRFSLHSFPLSLNPLSIIIKPAIVLPSSSSCPPRLAKFTQLSLLPLNSFFSLQALPFLKIKFYLSCLGTLHISEYELLYLLSLPHSTAQQPWPCFTFWLHNSLLFCISIAASLFLYWLLFCNNHSSTSYLLLLSFLLT